MNPLATARQLWRLNQEGRLLLVQEVDSQSPVSAVEADVAIKAVLSGAVSSARAKHSQS